MELFLLKLFLSLKIFKGNIMELITREEVLKLSEGLRENRMRVMFDDFNSKVNENLNRKVPNNYVWVSNYNDEFLRELRKAGYSNFNKSSYQRDGDALKVSW